MQVSARNQLAGTVKEIKQDDIMAEVTLQLADGVELVAVITASSAQRLNISVGSQVYVIVKSTDVMIGAD
ncbi:MAG: TOBE domain-containing protein [Chloroflexaceae bacterium]|nr:TOBE domain-containing protein [Chloroflexaceae bacterium]NJL33615.1 TOBE domain-containing protein [Chloroflexaceae bacterium]NJO06580.1 TOBE domain-containing protein [Chloroflexaceae bacterium]